MLENGLRRKKMSEIKTVTIQLFVDETDEKVQLNVDMGEDFDMENLTPPQNAAVIMINHLMDYVENWENIIES
jgi:hypothetical protein